MISTAQTVGRTLSRVISVVTLRHSPSVRPWVVWYLPWHTQTLTMSRSLSCMIYMWYGDTFRHSPSVRPWVLWYLPWHTQTLTMSKTLSRVISAVTHSDALCIIRTWSDIIAVQSTLSWDRCTEWSCWKQKQYLFTNTEVIMRSKGKLKTWKQLRYLSNKRRDRIYLEVADGLSH